MKLQEVLKKQLHQRGVTIREVAANTGIKRSTLADWLAGTQPRDLNEVRTLARYLGVTFEFLVFGESDNSDILNTLQTDLIFEGLVKIRLEKVTVSPVKTQQRKGPS